LFGFLKKLTAGTPSIDVAELDARLTAGEVRLLDVREPNEFKDGHVPGAVNVSMRRLPDQVGKLKKDKPYAVICESGSRSNSATGYLLEQGFEGVVSVRGGTSAWRRSGRKISR